MRIVHAEHYRGHATLSTENVATGICAERFDPHAHDRPRFQQHRAGACAGLMGDPADVIATIFQDLASFEEGRVLVDAVAGLRLQCAGCKCDCTYTAGLAPAEPLCAELQARAAPCPRTTC